MPVWAIAALCYSALEFWLGKTNKVKANSALEAILKGGGLLISIMARRK